MSSSNINLLRFEVMKGTSYVLSVAGQALDLYRIRTEQVNIGKWGKGRREHPETEKLRQTIPFALAYRALGGDVSLLADGLREPIENWDEDCCRQAIELLKGGIADVWYRLREEEQKKMNEYVITSSAYPPPYAKDDTFSKNSFLALLARYTEENCVDLYIEAARGGIEIDDIFA